MKAYSDSFKRKMVQRLLAPGASSAVTVASETGVHHTTLSRWMVEARTLPSVTDTPLPLPVASSPTPRRPDDWTAEQKLVAVQQMAGLEGVQLGEFLRREGLHEAQLVAWSKAALEGLRGPAKGSRVPGEAKRIRELERQLLRKDKALAEVAALLILKKKAQAIWGDADDDTSPETDK
jgi:transposase-like protein